MIVFLNGILEYIEMEYCIINVNDIGYKVYLPTSTRDEVGAIGDKIKLYTYMNVKDDAIELYGFRTQEELEFFKTITTVSGIGPKMGLKILSSISPKDFKIAIIEENMPILTSIPGIGKKTAQRLLFELKDKIGDFELSGSTVVNRFGKFESDACEALLTLGYTRGEVVAALKYARTELGDDLETFELANVIQCMLKFFQVEKD